MREKVTTDSRFRPVNKTCYMAIKKEGGGYRYKFREGMTDVISITDAYLAVREIGRSADFRTLHELTILSHGYQGGPILVNSYDDGFYRIRWGAFHSEPLAPPYNARDPDDKDGRHIKDFSHPTMGPSARDEFALAFHRDGCVWLWGCQFTHEVHTLLSKVLDNPKYRPSGLTDFDKLTFRGLSEEEVELVGYLHVIDSFTLPTYPVAKVDLFLQYLKFIFCAVNRGYYPQHMANTAKVRTYAALQGTYSTYDPLGTKLGVMHVPSGFAGHITFYKNYLGFTIDPEGRGFAAYEPGVECTIPSPVSPGHAVEI